MASRDDWLVTYRTFTDAELDAEIILLNSKRTNFLSSQGAGSKNFTVDRTAIDNQFTAAREVKGERTRSGNNRSGSVDFSGVDIN